MNQGKIFDSEKLSCKLQDIVSVVHDAAAFCQGDTIALLALLRQLEELHREIRDGAFQNNLPNNRQALYSLLKDIESEGGWALHRADETATIFSTFATRCCF